MKVNSSIVIRDGLADLKHSVLVVENYFSMKTHKPTILFLFLTVIAIAFATKGYRLKPTDVTEIQEIQELQLYSNRIFKLRTVPNSISMSSDNSSRTSDNFLTPNYTIVQAQIGSTAVLHCEVVDTGENTVSWIRKRDYHLLTVGLQTYSSDKRFFTSNGKNGQDWILHIRYSQSQDSGLYECQLTTYPASSLFVELQLVEAHASIIGGSEKIVKSGSPLRLSCVIQRSTEVPQYIFWYHENHMINYDLKGGAAVRHGRQGSELLIPRAEIKHAGNYSCVPSNARPANVIVHVLQSEKPAAMQHDSKGGSTVSYVSRYVLYSLMLYLLTVHCRS